MVDNQRCKLLGPKGRRFAFALDPQQVVERLRFINKRLDEIVQRGYYR